MSQSLAKIYIHLVFSTKGRADTIPKANLEEVHAYMAEIFNNHGCPAIQVGGTTNHVHILFLLGKQVELSEIVRTVKSSTSRWINEKTGKPFRHFAWQDGYGAFFLFMGIRLDRANALSYDILPFQGIHP